MNRINIVTRDPETGEADLEGWFDLDKATAFQEATYWDGHNHISVATGTQWDHEVLYCTAGDRWALQRWSQWQGRPTTWRFVSEDEAHTWLALNDGHDEVVAIYWPGELDEAGPSETPRRSFRIPDELWQEIRHHAATTNRTATDVILTAVRDYLKTERFGLPPQRTGD